MNKPRLAVHKFSSCDGCQLALLNLGETLLELARQVEIVHFAEAGYLAAATPVDIALVEGSISTPHEVERIAQIRANSKLLVTIGACATSGGLQALRNLADKEQWVAGIYAQPHHIALLKESTAIADHVKVDLELWGCPVTSQQVVTALRALLFGVLPAEESDKVCLECKRRQQVCVMVTRGEPCLGSVTRTGCGAICPSVGRDCYGCFGPAETLNTSALAQRFAGFGLLPEAIARRFLLIYSHEELLQQEGEHWLKQVEAR
ncbi:MAG TPA: sulfhydrogenase subunit delta [Gammaproteobacteria bacterium]